MERLYIPTYRHTYTGFTSYPCLDFLLTSIYCWQTTQNRNSNLNHHQFRPNPNPNHNLTTTHILPLTLTRSSKRMFCFIRISLWSPCVYCSWQGQCDCWLRSLSRTKNKCVYALLYRYLCEDHFLSTTYRVRTFWPVLTFWPTFNGLFEC